MLDPKLPTNVLNASLLSACENNRKGLVMHWISNGANINTTGHLGNTPLILAAKNGYIEIVKFLLSIPGIDVNIANQDAETALMWAAYFGRISVVEELLTFKDININATDKTGSNALIWAAQNGYTLVVIILINKIACVDSTMLNATDIHGNTALIIAAEFNQTTIMDALIKAGANINIKNKNEDTALTFACKNKHSHTAFRLLSSMKYQAVHHIQSDSVLGAFSTKCIRKVFFMQKMILNVLRIFYATPALSDTNGPIRLVISHILPDWYQHRANADTKIMMKKLTKILVKREKKATLPILPLSIQHFLPYTGMITRSRTQALKLNNSTLTCESPRKPEIYSRKKPRCHLCY